MPEEHRRNGWGTWKQTLKTGGRLEKGPSSPPLGHRGRGWRRPLLAPDGPEFAPRVLLPGDPSVPTGPRRLGHQSPTAEDRDVGYDHGPGKPST